MKKIFLLGLALMTIATAFAQKSLVKEVERELKANPASYPKAIQKLQPAFTNEESASDAYTWFVAGKGAFDYYDQQSVFAQMGKDVDKKQLGLSVMEGFDYITKALPLDTIVDAKGKVKTKYSKDVLKQIVNHYNDFNNGALFLWEAEDYGDAVKSWELYTSLPKCQKLTAAGLKAPADTLIAEIRYNMGIGYSLTQNNEKALENFKEAIAGGYTKKNAFDYAIAAASQMRDFDEMANVAQQAYAVFPDDSRYIGYMINNLIDKKEYGKADALLDKYIAENPQNGQLYFIKGVLCDSEGNPQAAKAAYEQAITLDPNNAQALMQYGYKIYQEASDIDQNESMGMSNAEYAQLRAERVDPLFRKAAEYLERAYELDNNIDDARNLLRNIYYNLKDGENLDRVNAM